TITSDDIAADAINAASINPDVAGAGLTQNASGALEVDGTAINGDGNITSSDLTVGGDTNALLGDVTLEIAPNAVGTTEIADGTITSDDIAADAINAASINPDVAGAGLTQNASGALEVDGTAINGDGNITSSDLTVGGDTNALLGDVTLEIAPNAVDASTINANVAGAGLTQNASGALEVDVTGISGDGSITSPNGTVTLTGTPANSLFENVGFDVNVPA
ncbi:hypothetical protein J8281_18910, partial [Aquimarina sp. U1-2]|uniref:hypothetical protein n=1 Tax=Aquimarina sp. U1-2 TaxID=2823141 RepID=UPI001AEC9633